MKYVAVSIVLVVALGVVMFLTIGKRQVGERDPSETDGSALKTAPPAPAPAREGPQPKAAAPEPTESSRARPPSCATSTPAAPEAAESPETHPEAPRMPDPRLPELAASLADKSELSLVREHAALAMAKMGERARPAVAVLIQALEGKDSHVARVAARALGSIGEGARKALPMLHKLRKEVDWPKVLIVSPFSKIEAEVKYGHHMLDRQGRVNPAEYFAYEHALSIVRLYSFGIDVHRFKTPGAGEVGDYAESHDFDALRHGIRLAELRAEGATIAQEGEPDHFASYRAAEMETAKRIMDANGYYALTSGARRQSRYSVRWDVAQACRRAIWRIEQDRVVRDKVRELTAAMGKAIEAQGRAAKDFAERHGTGTQPPSYLEARRVLPEARMALFNLEFDKAKALISEACALLEKAQGEAPKP